MEECIYCNLPIKAIEMHPSIINEDTTPICPECVEYFKEQSTCDKCGGTHSTQFCHQGVNPQDILDNPEDYGLV